MKIFNKIILIAALSILFSNCGVTRTVPVQEKIVYSYRDTTIFKTDTVSVPLPFEVVREIVLADSSHLETSVAVSDVWVDSLYVLHHTLENKKTDLKKEVEYKEKIIYRDSTIVKEVPVEVVKEVKTFPSWIWYSLGLNILILIILAIKIFKKI